MNSTIGFHINDTTLAKQDMTNQIVFIILFYSKKSV